MEKAVEVYKNKTKKIPTSRLNDTMLDEIARNPPPSMKGKFIQIKYITQVPARFPSIAFFCNHPSISSRLTNGSWKIDCGNILTLRGCQ